MNCLEMNSSGADGLGRDELSGDEQSRGRWSGQGMNCLEMNSPGTDGLDRV